MTFIDSTGKEHSFRFESRYWWGDGHVNEDIIRYIIDSGYHVILPLFKIKNKELASTYKDYDFPEDLISFFEKIIQDKYLQLI
jgi:hypothetical protein